MSGGVIVAGCVIVAVALIEELLSRISRGARCRLKDKEHVCAKTNVLPTVDTLNEASNVISEDRMSGERGLTVVETLTLGANDEPEMLWEEARGMIHNESPDFSTDWQYLTLVCKAAELGHLKSMSKLGDYAFKRGDVVEAFYWKLRVEMCGGRCRNPSLTDIIRTWSEVGCPDGSEDIGVSLSEQRADFAHAVLCLKSGVDSRYGTMRLKELADAGVEDAMCFLKRI